LKEVVIRDDDKRRPRSHANGQWQEQIRCTWRLTGSNIPKTHWQHLTIQHRGTLGVRGLIKNDWPYWGRNPAAPCYW
jgi:hypothetical protein